MKLGHIFVRLTLMTKQLLIHEVGRLGGRQRGRKCGEVDDFLSEHGKTYQNFQKPRKVQAQLAIAN